MYPCKKHALSAYRVLGWGSYYCWNTQDPPLGSRHSRGLALPAQGLLSAWSWENHLPTPQEWAAWSPEQ